jgi:hypothetical protein
MSKFIQNIKFKLQLKLFKYLDIKILYNIRLRIFFNYLDNIPEQYPLWQMQLENLTHNDP